MKSYLVKCVVCDCEFETSDVRKKACSLECRRAVSNLKIREQRRIDNNEKFKNVLDIPTCKICGWKSNTLQQHLVTHNLTVSQYKEQYQADNSDIFHSSYTKVKSDRMSGDKNPGYQHNGTMSSFSKENKKYEDLTDLEKEEAIQKQITKANKTKKANSSYTTTLEYYTSRGFMLDEAIALRSKRQTTFSLEICTEKHGEEKGIEVWKTRQEKWLATLDSLPEEEKDRIYNLKMEAIQNIIPYSKISMELFTSLGTPGALYGENEYGITSNKKRIFPDFLVPSTNKIIEFYGNYWHANPEKYAKDYEVVFPYNKRMTAEQVWNKDTNRINGLLELGYEVLIIWESDYKKDKQGTIQKCLEFLNN